MPLESRHRPCRPGRKSTPAQRRPNILFVFADQLRAQSVGCYGNNEVKTPHLDRLAGEGVLFRHTVANTPVCCPARANMLTGKYAHKNGYGSQRSSSARDSEVTIAEIPCRTGLPHRLYRQVASGWRATVARLRTCRVRGVKASSSGPRMSAATSTSTHNTFGTRPILFR